TAGSASRADDVRRDDRPRFVPDAILSPSPMDSFTTASPAPRWRRGAHGRRDHQRAKAAGPSRAAHIEVPTMSMTRGACLGFLASLAAITAASAPAVAQEREPDILLIIG